MHTLAVILTKTISTLEDIIYKIKDGEIIKGVRFNVLLNNRDALLSHRDFTLIDLKVYSDGEFDCLGPITLDKLRGHFETGKLTLTLPAEGRLFIPYIGNVLAGYSASENSVSQKEHEGFLELIEKTIQKLKSNEAVSTIFGASTAADCILRFKEWLINPSDENFEKLKHSYLKLPNGQNALFEINPRKDPLIELMNGGATLTRERREYYLTDHFEGEWIELQ